MNMGKNMGKLEKPKENTKKSIGMGGLRLRQIGPKAKLILLAFLRRPIRDSSAYGSVADRSILNLSARLP